MPDRRDGTSLAVPWLRFLRWLGYPVKLPAEREVPYSIEAATAMQRHLNEHRSLIAEHVFSEPRLHLAVHPGYPVPEYVPAVEFAGRWIILWDRHGKPLRVESWGFDIEPVDSTPVLAELLRTIPVQP